MLNSRRAFVLAAGAILFYQLILPPVVGLADNGDFGKVIGRFDLSGQFHHTYTNIDTVYRIRPETHWVSDFYSLEIPLAQLAVWLNRVVSKDGNFDLRSIGIVHGALFLLAVWLFVPLLAGQRRGVRWAICALALFMFCDMMYVAPLNSFYMDEPAYLFLLLTAVAYLRVIRFGRKRDGVLLMAFPFLMVAGKAPHALLGFSIAILFLVGAGALKPIARGKWYAAAACLVLASVLMIWKSHPRDYAGYSVYSVTFEEILPHSQNAARTMADLGLDDSYRSCIGKKAYTPNSGMDDPGFRERFAQRLSYGKLAVFYARHPAVAYHTMVDALSETGRQHAFGNFDVSLGYSWSAESAAFASWSDVKRHFFFHHGLSFLLTFLALVALFGALLWLERRRLPRGALPAGIWLIGAAAIELCVSTLSDSMDLTRHSILFFALFDMMALACVYLAIGSLVRRAWWRLPAFARAGSDPPVTAHSSELPHHGAPPPAQAPPPVQQPAPAANPTSLSEHGAIVAPVSAPASPPVATQTAEFPDRARLAAQAPRPVPQPPPAADPTPIAEPGMHRVDRCLFAFGTLLVAAYFFRLTRASLHVYFTGDDLMNLYRSWYFSAGRLAKANLLFFLNSDFLRPMGSVWYRAIFDLAGFHPFWFHACNLAILSANIWLTYAVARRLAGSREIAALTALAMAYQERMGSLYFDTGFVYDVLCYFFLFAALALYLRVRAGGATLRWWHWVAFFVLYICALNSKEIAVMLPAFLAAYELLYHPPGDWRFASLRRWLLLEGWPTVVAGAVAVLFVVGRSIGPQTLLHNDAYRPAFTWAQFLLTSAHFAGEFFARPAWPAWAVPVLWAALAAIALGTRSRVLGFAWLYLMLSPLPIAFILPRGPAQYYVCVFGWMLYAAVVLVRTARFFTRGMPLPEWWLTRARGALLFVVSMAILYSIFKPLGYAAIGSVTEVAPLNRAMAEQLHAAAPAIRNGSRLLFLNDPINPDIYDLLFLVRLSYSDPSIEVSRVKQMPQPPKDREIALFDYVFDYRDGRFVPLKKPGQPSQ